MVIPILPLLAAGGLAAMTPIGRILNTPGAMLRGALAGRPGDELSGEELLGELFGPSEGLLTQAGGLLAEVALDPLNFLGAGAGALAGNRISNALGRAGQKALLAEQINSLGKIEDVANFGKTLTGTGDDIVPLAMRGLAEGPAYQAATAAHAMPYQPAILDELGGKMATYSRVDDAARGMMMRTGLGVPTGGGGMMTFLPAQARRPTYMAGRGGKMFLEDPAWAGLQHDDLLVGGGLYDKPANLAGLLPESQLAELSQMAYLDTHGLPVDLLNAPVDQAADLATDMFNQRVRMSEQIPEPNAIIQAMYRMGFR